VQKRRQKNGGKNLTLATAVDVGNIKDGLPNRACFAKSCYLLSSVGFLFVMSTLAYV